MSAATSYHFVRCQVHPAFNDIQGWFLEVQSGDANLLKLLHASMTAKYRSMLGEDSHGKPGPSNADLMAMHWLHSLEEELHNGVALLNSAGGIVAKCDLIVVADTHQLDLTWPEHFADEIITISKWPKGRHYYLCSNHERVFVPAKFNTYQAAEKAALKYVSADRIKSRL